MFWLLAVLIAAIPAAHSISLPGPFTLPKVLIFWLGAGALTTAFGLTVLTRGPARLPSGPGAILPGALLALLIFSTAFSIDPIISIVGARGRHLGLFTYLAAVVFFYAAASSVTTERMALFSRFIAVPAAAISLLALAQRAGLKYPVDFSRELGARAGGTIGNPNFLGIYLAMALILALGLAGAERPRGRKAWWATSAVIGAGLLATNSLAAWIAAAAAGALFTVFYPAKRRDARPSSRLVKRAAAPAALTVALIALLIFRTDAASSLADRLAIWTGGARAFARAPLLGTGLDTLAYVMPKVQPLSLGPREFGDAHNLFLTLGGSAGAAALLIFLSMVWFWARGTKMDAAEAPQSAVLLFSYKLCLAVYVIGHLFGPESIAPLAVFWTIAGVVAGTTTRALALSDRARAPGAFAALTGAVLVAIFATVGARMWRAETDIKAALREPDLARAFDYADAAQDSWPYYAFYGMALFDRAAPRASGEPEVAAGLAAGLNGAVASAPRDADAYYLRGSLNSMLRAQTDGVRYESLALADWRRSLELNRLRLPANYEIAKLYLARGDKTRAAAHLRLILALIDDTDEHRPEIEALLRRASR